METQKSCEIGVKIKKKVMWNSGNEETKINCARVVTKVHAEYLPICPQDAFSI